MNIGMTLGKFAPLHRGHQSVIERALAETDHVLVLLYDAPEVTSCPLPVRANWIRQLYPAVEIIAAWDGPTETGSAPEITRQHDAYILQKLAGRQVTHFYSSEFYGDHVSRALGALDCRVDPDRSRIPVSGTMIRQNPYACREFLAPVVYRDLVAKVVFLGAPSTGKTTLAAQLAAELQTVWMPEYGREYWDQHQSDRRLTPEQLVEIAEGHRVREDKLVLEANRFLLVDTDATTTYQFALYYHGATHPRLAALADETLRRYDVFFLCEDDIPYDDTWDRSGAANRTLFQKQIRADLIQRKIPFVSVRGTLAERVRFVSSFLSGFDRFDSLASHLLRIGKDGV
ncbi:MAG: AAA family ATPase [Blastocatellia bacterium]|nr:AAA family ATPase [Blastocatellia bacterium]